MQTINSNRGLRRQTYIIVTCVLLISLVIGGVSYSSFSTIGDASNNTVVDNFPLTATYKGTEYISGELPNLKDDWGIELDGTSFSVLNNSDEAISYYVLIEALDNTKVDNIKINIDDSEPKLLSKLDKKDGKYVLFEGVLKEKNDVGDVITHIVRTWSNNEGINVNLKLSVIPDETTIASEQLVENMQSDENIIKDPFGNLRYVGEDPANYIKFNDELWRIVGVFNVVRTNNREEYRIKLVRNESITSTPFRITDNFEWNSNCGSILYDYAYGKNTNINAKLSKEAFNYIDHAYYNLGGLKDYSDYKASDYYDNEISSTDNFGRNGKERLLSGILSISDYYYASSDETMANWLNNGTEYWLMNNNSSDINKAFYVNSEGNVELSSNTDSHELRPAVYLKSTVVFNGGDGSITNPYILK